jgi:hypothetical protein
VSRVQAMLAFRPVAGSVTPPPQPNGEPKDPPPPDHPDPRQPGRNRARQLPGALFRWVRQREVSAPTSWRPWWLLGLVEVVTYPLPRYLDQPMRRLVLPAVRAYEDLPARPERVLLVPA